MKFLSLIGITYGYQIWMHSSFGGRSHIGRMLEIGATLSNRGHNVTYVGLSDNMEFAHGLPVNLLDLGGYGTYQKLKHMAQHGLMADRHSINQAFKKVHNKAMSTCYSTEYPKLEKALQNPPDLLVCDAIAFACQDLAHSKGIPLIISYQKYQSNLISPKIQNYGLQVSTSYVGIETPMESHQNLKFLGPFPTATPKLDHPTLKFLARHSKVAYVGFGPLMVLKTEEISRILEALDNAIQAGILDGVVWGAGATNLKSFPEYLNSNKYLILKWSKQKAILNHPHTKLFVTHAGFESTLEAITSRTPTLAMPLVFDQPINAKRISDLGIGKSIQLTSPKEMIFENIVQILGQDQANIQLALRKMQAIALSNPNAHESAANLILAYTQHAATCRKFDSFDSTKAPCELAHLIPSPVSTQYWKIQLFILLSTAILFYLLAQRVWGALKIAEKLRKLD